MNPDPTISSAFGCPDDAALQALVEELRNAIAEESKLFAPA
jgi:hypothetical protein